MEPVGKLYSKSLALEAFESKKVVIIAGGTGNPYFTTDTASALRGVEIEAAALLKGTRVDGVYDSDPEKNPNAVKYDNLTFDKAYSDKLKVMDLTAFTMCQENNLPIIVFDMNKKGNLKELILGQKVGSIIEN
jgi:uridylate kinase